MSEPTLNEADHNRERGPDAFASALGRLAPAASGLDRDRLMFLAGARARNRARSQRWTSRAWPIVAGLLALIVAGESALLVRTRQPRVIERVVVVHEPAARPSSSSHGDFQTASDGEPSHVAQWHGRPARDGGGTGGPPLIFAQNADAPEKPPNLGLLSAFFQPGPALARYRHLQELALQFKLDADPGPAAHSTGPNSAGAPRAPGAVPPVLEELRGGDLKKFLSNGDFAWPPSFSL